MTYNQTPTLNDVDTLMSIAMIGYTRGNLEQTVFTEMKAYTFLDSIQGKDTTALKATLLQPVQTQKLEDLKTDSEMKRLQEVVDEFKHKYDNYMSSQYYPTLNKDGLQQADFVKQYYSGKLEKAKNDAQNRDKEITTFAMMELSKLSKGFPDRKKNYDNLRSSSSNVVYVLKDADDSMLKAYDAYLNGTQQKQIDAEVTTYSILDTIDGQPANRLKSTLLQPKQLIKATQLQANYDAAKILNENKTNQFTTYMSDTYGLNLQTLGIGKADSVKEDYAKQKNRASILFQQASDSLNAERLRLTKGFPLRKKNYDLTKLEFDPNFKNNPIVEMNTVLSDLMVAYPDQNSQANLMNQQVNHIYDNYQLDISYATLLDGMMLDLSNNGLEQLERDLQFKKKTLDIQEYYHKNYQQQIVILKIVLFFSLLALVGGLLLNYQIISVSFFAVYLGVDLSIGFIVLFYYLWDFYLRDNTNFDEYNFMTYNANKSLKHDVSNNNIAYC